MEHEKYTLSQPEIVLPRPPQRETLPSTQANRNLETRLRKKDNDTFKEIMQGIQEGSLNVSGLIPRYQTPNGPNEVRRVFPNHSTTLFPPVGYRDV